MNLEKIENSKISNMNKENTKEERKKNKIKFNLIWPIFMISFFIVCFQFIYAEIYNKKEKQEINLRNTESLEYSIDKSISYDKNGQKIYSKNNFINFNKLDKYYNGVNEQDTSKYNNIHITLCVNEDYHLLALVTIASILKNADQNSYIHFHIIALNNLKFEIMKKIYSLKSNINNNSEFIFYNGKKVEEDFELGIKVSERGSIDYGRLLITELIENIDKVISIDIGDIFVEKDLFELYKKDLGYFGYLAVEDAYPKCFLESIFNHKDRYVNGGVILLNVKKWKEINLYQYIVKMFKYVLTKTKFYNPYTDIMNDFLPWGSTGYMELKYNFPDYIIENGKNYDIWNKQCSYYFYKKEKVLDAERNVVIRNLYNYKVYKGQGTEEMKNLWKKYVQLTGFNDEICKKYIC